MLLPASSPASFLNLNTGAYALFLEPDGMAAVYPFAVSGVRSWLLEALFRPLFDYAYLSYEAETGDF